MTTLPPNYLRLSSKWLETNPLPEDGLLLEADDTWKPSSQRGRITATPGFDYATARTDLPREAYADSEPGAEVASERAEDRITGWVNCPVCGEPDMRRTEDPEGNPLIFCVNHACRSNGGANDDAITQDALEAEREKHKETAKDFETAFRLVRQENDTLRAQLDAKEAELWRIKAPSVDEGSLNGLKIEYNAIDNRFYVYAADGSFLWSGDAFFNAWQCARLTAELEAKEAECQRLQKDNKWLRDTLTNREKTLSNVNSEVASARTERDKLRAECRELRELSERRAETIAVAMHNQKVADQDHASTVSSIRSENDKLRAEVEHRTKQRDEFQNLFIEASDGFNRRGEQLARLTAELDAAQARCGELERAVTRIASMEPHQHSTTCMEMHRIATALLTPSQQPDNFDSSGGESRTAIAGADGSKHTEGDCNPQGSESRKANPKIASESSASPAVNPSRPEPVKAGEWLPMEAAPKRKVRLRIQTSPDAFRTVEALWINGQWDFDGMLFFKPVGWKPIAPEEA